MVTAEQSDTAFQDVPQERLGLGGAVEGFQDCGEPGGAVQGVGVVTAKRLRPRAGRVAPGVLGEAQLTGGVEGSGQLGVGAEGFLVAVAEPVHWVRATC